MKQTVTAVCLVIGLMALAFAAGVGVMWADIAKTREAAQRAIALADHSDNDVFAGLKRERALEVTVADLEDELSRVRQELLVARAAHRDELAQLLTRATMLWEENRELAQELSMRGERH